ncbi:MAG TPA: energy transducer TonB [Thermoanaerobaculia bacterium]|nr:energy transducer TonB [Thermoanaerobaculia bacterium]
MNSLLILLAISASPKPIDVAYLVNEKDAAAIVEPLRIALTSPDPLVRVTAARVIGVRDEKALVADLRKTAEQESDAGAAREELRSIALLGTPDDVDYAIAAAAKWPASVDNDVAQAIARRGGTEALDFYLTKLSHARTLARADFFRRALWGRPGAMTVTAARLVGIHDEQGWLAYLGVMRDSHVPVTPSILGASFGSASEPIRVASIWYAVNTYAADPGTAPQAIHDDVATPRDDVSVREGFGLELVRRIAGFEKRENDKWIAWLESDEADHLLGHASTAVEMLLTDREYAVRQKRCGIQPVACDMPEKRPTHSYPPSAVPPPAFQLPGELPAGMSAALGTCGDDWLGLAGATVDTTGRVQAIDLAHMSRTACSRQIETMLRLSYATNTSVMSPLAMPDVVLAHARRDPLCLDEDPPSDESASPLSRVGGEITAPVKIHSVEPSFPENVRRNMSPGSNSILILETVITKHGCIRSIRPLAQSPFPELNGAAIFAVSQWKFSPALVKGKPVEVLYNLTVNFKLSP